MEDARLLITRQTGRSPDATCEAPTSAFSNLNFPVPVPSQRAATTPQHLGRVRGCRQSNQNRRAHEQPALAGPCFDSPRNSGGTVIRCSRSRANHCTALNYSQLRVLFMTAFPHATGKFARRNRAAKAFLKDRTAFISRTGREGCGMRGSHPPDEPYHLYIASIVLRAARLLLVLFFF